MGHLAVLDGHGRVSRIPPITIFLIAHCIADRPVSLYDHRVGFKVCCTVRQLDIVCHNKLLCHSHFIINRKIIPCQSPVVVILFA